MTVIVINDFTTFQIIMQSMTLDNQLREFTFCMKQYKYLNLPRKVQLITK